MGDTRSGLERWLTVLVACLSVGCLDHPLEGTYEGALTLAYLDGGEFLERHLDEEAVLSVARDSSGLVTYDASIMSTIELHDLAWLYLEATEPGASTFEITLNGSRGAGERRGDVLTFAWTGLFGGHTFQMDFDGAARPE